MPTIAAVVLALATIAAAATGTVGGTVTLRGAPVAGVKVTIESDSDSSYAAMAHTDAEGRFRFSEAPVGGVILKALDERGTVVATQKGTLKEQDEVMILRIELAP